jgi:hypothetical protein
MKNKQPAGLSCRPSWAGVAVFLVLFSIAMAYAEHTASTEFLKGYHGSGNQSCCGLNDCVEATVALLDEGDTESTLMIGEHIVTLPNAALHPSPDPGGRGWWCYVPQAVPDGKTPTYVDQYGNVRALPPEKPTRENSRCVFFISTL